MFPDQPTPYIIRSALIPKWALRLSERPEFLKDFQYLSEGRVIARDGLIRHLQKCKPIYD